MTDGATWLDLVHEYFPDATDEYADFLLWERTAFPFASPAHVRMQLRAVQLMPKCAICDKVYEQWSLGGDVKEIAHRFGMTQKTVREHLRIIKLCLKQAKEEMAA